MRNCAPDSTKTPTSHDRGGKATTPTNQPYDPQRPIRVPTFALRVHVSIEFEFFVIAVRNVLRAQKRLPEDMRPEMTDQRLFHLTRNITEHWDRVGGWSADAFADEYPDRGLGQISATSKEGCVSDVPLSRVTAWLARVNDMAHRPPPRHQPRRQIQLGAFVDDYNHRRPHRSLPHRATPATVYASRMPLASAHWLVRVVWGSERQVKITMRWLENGEQREETQTVFLD